MEKYKIELTNSQVISIGDENEVKENTIEMTNSSNNSMDLEKIKVELAMLEKFLREKKEKDAKERDLMLDIIELRELTKEGTEENVINELKGKATHLFFNLSSGVGAGIIANILSKALGI